MVIVRLARRGTKGRPYYHIVATNKQSRRDGRFIEQLGTYDPSKEYADASVNLDRVDHWLSTGAQLTERAAHIVRAAKTQADQAASA